MIVVTPLMLRLWDDYEAANARCRIRYFTSTGTHREIKDQSGRKRKTKQVR